MSVDFIFGIVFIKNYLHTLCILNCDYNGLHCIQTFGLTIYLGYFSFPFSLYYHLQHCKLSGNGITNSIICRLLGGFAVKCKFFNGIFYICPLLIQQVQFCCFSVYSTNFLKGFMGELPFELTIVCELCGLCGCLDHNGITNSNFINEMKDYLLQELGWSWVLLESRIKFSEF